MSKTCVECFPVGGCMNGDDLCPVEDCLPDILVPLCPVCRSSSRRAGSQDLGLSTVMGRCERCGGWFQHPLVPSAPAPNIFAAPGFDTKPATMAHEEEQ
jgi:hypothetical protein